MGYDYMSLPARIDGASRAYRGWRGAMARCVFVSFAALCSAVHIAGVPADKTSVWDGVYTEEQANRGRGQYLSACSSCHREDLGGQGDAPALAGEQFMFSWGEKTVADLYTQIQTTMPANAPGSLSAQACADIVAYLLQRNKFPVGDEGLAGDPARLRPFLITKTAPASKR